MSQHYSDPKRESDPHALPDIEVFYQSIAKAAKQRTWEAQGGEELFYGPSDPGWYWWACFPGCLPDSDPIGPFATEAEALADARNGQEG